VRIDVFIVQASAPPACRVSAVPPALSGWEEAGGVSTVESHAPS